MAQDSPSGTGARWDLVAEELQALRLAAGDPSYGEIARRITGRRLAAGHSAHAARVARTTVYDAFRTGRARINVSLVREIVQALGRDPDLVDDWVAGARAGSPPPAHSPAALPLPPAAGLPSAVARSRYLVLVLLLACIAVNLIGRNIVELLHLSIFLDMVGTAIAAIVLGPWYGAAVGLTTNVLGAFESGSSSIPFAAVNVAGALAWGYGVHRLGMGRTLPRFFLLNVLVALICSLVAVPILVLVFGGTTGHGQDGLTKTLMELNRTLLVAVGLSNILVSLADKLLSGFMALVAAAALPLGLRYGVPLMLMPPAELTGDRAPRGRRGRDAPAAPPRRGGSARPSP